VIILNANYGNWAEYVVKIGYGLAVLTGYPVLISPIYDIFEEWLFKNR